MKRGYVDSEWGQVHYRTAGSAGPSVVIFHESPLSSEIFVPTIELLGGSVTVWAFDTPGYGLSDAPPDPPEITDYARVLLGAIDTLGIGKFAVIGSHTGVSIALEVMARSDIERVTHLILSGIPLFTTEERARYQANHAPDIELEGDGRHLLWAWDRYYDRSLRPGPTGSEATTAGLSAIQNLEFVNLLASHILRNHERYNWGYRAAFRHDVRPGLRDLRRPTLILNSDLDTLAHLDDDASAIIPDASLVRLRGVGGRPYWLAPECYADAVMGFLLGPDAEQGQL